MSIPRKPDRKRSYLAAFATAEDGREHIFCMVRDLTRVGARVEVEASGPLPDQFDLQIAGRERVWRAQVSWRSSTTLGVSFVQSHAREKIGTA